MKTERLCYSHKLCVHRNLPLFILLYCKKWKKSIIIIHKSELSFLCIFTIIIASSPVSAIKRKYPCKALQGYLVIKAVLLQSCR